MRIQERDKKILRLAYDHGFVERKHIRCFFPDEPETSRRIHEYVGHGYLKVAPCPARNEVIFLITRKGVDIVEQGVPYYLPYRPISHTKVLHDSFVIMTRIRLEQLWIGHWIPERLLPRTEEIPDGIFQFPSGKKVYVELENSHKEKARFLYRLQEFSGQILILYITTKPEVYRSIRRTTDVLNLPPMALISLDSLLSPTPQIWSPTNKLSIFHQKEF